MSKRTQNSLRNIFFGALNRTTAIIFPFIVRTILIRYLGEEYLGLNSLFRSILQVLNLADLGLSSAISASMYKPIAEKDTLQVSSLMNLYKRVYRVIGTIILILGIGICPFIHHFISGSPPEGINIYIIWMLYLADTVSSYLLFAHKTSLINAHQRSDIIDIIHTVTRILISVIQITAVIRYKNMYGYIFLGVIFTIASNIWSGLACDKMYPQYACIGEISAETKKQITRNISALALQKVGNTVYISLDSIIISAFLGLSTVAIYGNYCYIISAITFFLNLVYSSITASIGDSIAVESIEKNEQDFQKLTFMSGWMVSWCCICFICLFQDFMTLWMGEKLLFSIGTVLCLVLRFYFEQIRKIVQTYKDAAGMWWADKWKPLVGCAVNLALNILLVKAVGIIGVILSTIVSYAFVEMPWETYVLFKNYFRKSAKTYYLDLFKRSVTALLLGTVTYFVCSALHFSSILNLFLKCLVCIVIPNVLFVLINRKNYVFKECASFLSSAVHSTIRKKH